MATKKDNYEEIPEPAAEAQNIYRVSARQWSKWSQGARKVFNYIYAQGTLNRDLMVSGKKPKRSETEDRELDVYTWNLAFVTAGFYDKIPQEA